MFLKSNCIQLLILQLTGNMLIKNKSDVAATSLVKENTANSKSLKLSLFSETTDYKNNKLEDEEFVKFLRNLTQEQEFTTIFILTNCSSNSGNQRDYCVDLKYYMDYILLQQDSLIPVLLLQSEQQDYFLYNKFDYTILTVLCIPPLSSYEFIQNHLLSALSKNLWYLRQNCVIIRMDLSSHPEEKTMEIIGNILEYCNMEEIINVIVVSYQFPYKDLEYYSFFKFPKFQIRKHRLIVGETELFPNQLLDLKGYTLLTIPDQVEPRSILYFDKNNKPQMLGYMGHFVKYFAKSLNATWAFAFEVKEGEKLFYFDNLNLTRNHTVDLAATLGGPGVTLDLYELSYTYEISCWCVILPVEAEISKAEIVLAVLNSYFMMVLILLCLCFTVLLLVVFKRITGPLYRFYWVDLLLNDKAFRAILGQGFAIKNRKLDYFVVYVFFLLFLTGLLVLVLYGVLLGSYMTSPPKKPPIKSFDDLDKSSIKLLISPQDFVYLNVSEYSHYHNLFEVIERTQYWEEYKRLNTSYAYALTLFLWQVLAEQQKRFSRPLFRYSKDLCFKPYIHSNIFVALHSVFREPLHIAILNVYAAGLYERWFNLGFYELVAVGRKSFEDLAKPIGVKPISVVDLKIVLVGFFISLLCSIVIFILELFVFFLGSTKQKMVNFTIDEPEKGKIHDP